MQTLLQRQQQFDAAGAGADDTDARLAAGSQDARARRLEAGQKSIDRLHGDGVVCHARGLLRARRRADVDRQHVVGHGRAVVANDAFVLEIKAVDLAVVEARVGKAAERTRIDVRFIGRVAPGDHPGQHARVGRVNLPGDQREAHAGHRVHAEHAQNADVGVAGADQDHVLDNRDARHLHGWAPTGSAGRSMGPSARRTGSTAIRNARRSHRESPSMPADSNTVAAINTTATSKRNSEMAPST